MRRLATLISIAVLTGCASVAVDAPKTSKTVNVDKMYSVANENGPLGQVCPISPRYALTAGHVSGVTLSPLFMGTDFRRVIRALLTEIEGGPAHLREYAFDNYRDLSIVEIKYGHSFPGFYRIADKRPLKGDKLYLRGFKVGDGFDKSVVEVEVVNIDMGYIYFKPAGEGGSSGSCLLNDNEEVVGINVHGYRFGVGSELGGGVLTVGAFGPDRFPDGVLNE